MTLDELLPSLYGLRRADKLRLIQLLAADVAFKDVIGTDNLDAKYPVWSPCQAFDGAATLLGVLKEGTVALQPGRSSQGSKSTCAWPPEK